MAKLSFSARAVRIAHAVLGLLLAVLGLIAVLNLIPIVASSQSLRGGGQARRLDQAQAPAEEPPAGAAAVEAQVQGRLRGFIYPFLKKVPDLQQADGQEEMQTTTALDTAGLSANATEAAEVPANVSAAETLLGAAPPAQPVCKQNGEICWRAEDCCSARCSLTERCASGR